LNHIISSWKMRQGEQKMMNENKDDVFASWTNTRVKLVHSSEAILNSVHLNGIASDAILNFSRPRIICRYV
jgi:hypothetical protein